MAFDHAAQAVAQSKAQSTALPFPKPGLPVHPSQPRALTLVARTQDTPDTVTFTFAVAGPVMQFHPGQAMALDLPLPSGPVTRTFTIASAPLGTDRVSLTIKAAPNATATRWMHDHLAIGDQITGRGAFGRFTLAAHPGRPLLLIGGGSGFTPMMSMLRWLHARREQADVTVVQVARHVEDLLFCAERDQIARDLPNLRLLDVVTAPRPGEAWRGLRGRPDRAMIRAAVPDATRREVFCCGPDGFMTHMGRVLRAEGLNADQFHTERFGPPSRSATPTAPPAPGDGHTVTFRNRTVTIPKDQPLSTALAAQGLRVPTGCGAGQCGTCRLKLLEGDVDMTQDGGLSEHEITQGYILACCSTAQTNLTLSDAE